MKKVFFLLFFFQGFIFCHPASGQSTSSKNYSIMLGGDFYMGETYQEREEAKGKKNILKDYGYDHSLNKLIPLLKKADKIIINLETPITNASNSPLQGKYKMHK